MTYFFSRARYAQRKIAIHCPADGSGLKTRAARLASGLSKNRTWSNREKAYIVTLSQAKRFKDLWDAGLDVCPMSGQFYVPGQ